MDHMRRDQRPRSYYTNLALAVVTAAIIVGASAAASSYLKTTRTVTTTLTIGDSLILSNVSSGIQLSVVIQPTGQVYGGNYTVTAIITDVLSTDVRLNASELVDPLYGPCPLHVATGLYLYSGRLTAATISTESPLQLYNPSLIYTCPTENAQQYSLNPGGNITETSVISGYWTSFGQGYTHVGIPPGAYTVVVFDAWGQSIIGYFQADYPAMTLE